MLADMVLEEALQPADQSDMGKEEEGRRNSRRMRYSPLPEPTWPAISVPRQTLHAPFVVEMDWVTVEGSVAATTSAGCECTTSTRETHISLL